MHHNSQCTHVSDLPVKQCRCCLLDMPCINNYCTCCAPSTDPIEFKYKVCKDLSKIISLTINPAAPTVNRGEKRIAPTIAEQHKRIDYTLKE